MSTSKFHPQAKRLAVLVVAFLLVAFAGGYAAVHGGIAAAKGLCDAQSLRTFAQEASDSHTRTYLLQEAQACEGKPVTASGTLAAADPSTSSTSTSTLPSASENSEQSDSTTSSSTSQTSETTSTTPSASATSNSGSAEQKADYVFYAWYSEKDGPNNFGPKVAMNPTLHGMPMQTMNTTQAKQELKYRYHRDPMLSASTGCAFKLWSCSPSTLQQKTRTFMDDPSTWNTAKAAIDRKIDGQSSSVKTLSAGSYVSTYALNGGDFPKVFSDEVHRTSNMEALVFDDGTTLRLICGFQPYWTLPKAPAPSVRPTPLPKPSPGMTRNDEGVPEKLVEVCNPATGKQIKVSVSKKDKYPQNTGKCKPATPTTTSTTPGTPTSTSTTPPPSTSTTPPTSTSTSTTPTNPPTSTTPPTPSSTLPPKCKTVDGKLACPTNPPGVEKPTDNPAAPTAEPKPTHTGPTLEPSSSATPSSTSEPLAPTATVVPTRTTPPVEAPSSTTPATGGPATGCAVCG